MKDALDIVGAFSTPILLVICWLVYRIKVNDIPHINERLQVISDKLSMLEGRQLEEHDARLVRRH